MKAKLDRFFVVETTAKLGEEKSYKKPVVIFSTQDGDLFVYDIGNEEFHNLTSAVSLNPDK
jgi:hypothetical protein